MDYLDELLALYAGRDALTRKYILWQLGDLKSGSDTATLVDFLGSQVGSLDTRIRHQARREVGRVMPSLIGLDYGLGGPLRGTWSGYFDRGTLEEFILEPTGDDVQGSSTGPLSEGMARLARSVEPLTRHLREGSHRVRQAASLVLGRVQARATMDALAARLASKTAGFGDAAALSELGSREAQSHLEQAVTSFGSAQPDLYMLLDSIRVEKALPILEAASEAVDDYGRCNIAQALGHQSDASRRFLARLVGRGEGWVTIYALTSMARSPRPDDLRLVIDAYERQTHEFVRSVAVRAAGGLPGRTGTPFLTQVLREGQPRVQAAALESLARQGCVTDDAVGVVRPLLRSPLLKARVNAMLFLAGAGSTVFGDSLHDLVTSADAVERLEGAFVLGHVATPAAAEALSEMARRDQALAVRVAAIKGLARQGQTVALDRLGALIAPDVAPDLAILATRALARLGRESLEAVEETLAAKLALELSPALRRELLRVLGSVAARRPRGGTPAPLVEHLDAADAVVVQGALEGLKCLGDRAPSDACRALAASPTAGIACQAVVAAVASGDVDAVADLDRWLSSSDEEGVIAALGALLEIAILLPMALRSRRFGRLRRALESRTTGQAAELIVDTAPPAPMSGAEDVPADAPKDVSSAAAGEVRRAQEAKGGEGGQGGQGLGLERTLDALRTNYGRNPKGAGPSGARMGSNLIKASYLGDMGASASGARRRLGPYAFLLVIPLCILLPILVIWLHRDAGGPEPGTDVHAGPLAPGKLSIARLKKKVTLTPPGHLAHDARLGEVVGPGDVLKTGAGAELELADRRGNTAWLGSSSEIRLENPAQEAAVPAGTEFLFTEAQGDILLDFRHSKGLELSVDLRHLRTPAGVLRLQTTDGGPQVTVSAGEVTYTEGSASPRILGAGETILLESSH